MRLMHKFLTTVMSFKDVGTWMPFNLMEHSITKDAMHQGTLLRLFLSPSSCQLSWVPDPWERSLAFDCCLVNNLLNELQTVSQMLWESETVKETVPHLMKMQWFELWVKMMIAVSQPSGTGFQNVFLLVLRECPCRAYLFHIQSAQMKRRSLIYSILCCLVCL